MRQKLPNFFVYSPILLVIPFIKLGLSANFGMIDDHLFLEVGDPSRFPKFGQLLHNYFSLQPYGHTKRFQPTQMFLWSIQSWVFKWHDKESPVMWYLVPCLLMLLSTILMIRLIDRIYREMCPSSSVGRHHVILYQIGLVLIFLSLPIWRTSGFKLGIPEIYEIPLALLVLTFSAKIYFGNLNSKNFLSLIGSVVLIVGVRETAFWYGLIPLILLWSQKRNLSATTRNMWAFFSIFSVMWSLWIVGGYYYQVLNSGSDIYSSPIGFSRLLSSYSGQGFGQAKYYLTLFIVTEVCGLFLLIFRNIYVDKKFLAFILGMNMTVFLVDSFMLGSFFNGQYSTQRIVYLYLTLSYFCLLVYSQKLQFLYFFARHKIVPLTMLIIFSAICSNFYLKNFDQAKMIEMQNMKFNRAISQAIFDSKEKQYPIKLISSKPWDYEPIYSTAFNLKRISNPQIYLEYTASKDQFLSSLSDLPTRKNLNAQLSAIEKSGNFAWKISAPNLNNLKFICLRMPNTEIYFKGHGCQVVYNTN